MTTHRLQYFVHLQDVKRNRTYRGYLPSNPFFLLYGKTESFLSPAWDYEGVTIHIGTKSYHYDHVQDDSGMDCGVGLAESVFTLGPLVRSASHVVERIVGTQAVQDETTIAVCQVEIESPPIKVWTILNGLGGEQKKPLLGRFMLQDVTHRLYSGILSHPLEGATPCSWKNMTDVPAWDEIIERFRTTKLGDELRKKVESQMQAGVDKFRREDYSHALAHFRWASVFGFFTHSLSEQYSILKNLASGWERYLQEERGPLDTALLWALEAQKVNDTPVVQGQIARIKANMSV